MNLFLTEKKHVETILSWGTIAYIAGFFTVMINTGLLGIPIIEIIKPVYIWIGLPLAIVIISLHWIWKTILLRINKLKNEFIQNKNEIPNIDKNRQQYIESDKTVHELITDFSNSIAYFLSIIPIPLIKRGIPKIYKETMTKLFIKIIDNAELSNEKEKKVFFSYIKFLSFLSFVLSTFNIINKALFFLVIYSLIPFSCYVYISRIYPIIPQSFGGGKPTNIVLFINSEIIPDKSKYESIFQEKKDSNTTDQKVIETKTLKMLYLTADYYFIKTEDHRILSLNKKNIEGVVWNPKQN